MLTARSLTIGYPHKVLASNLNLELRPGEMVALIGPNGCGKSTLLRTLAGMLPPLSGQVFLNGRDIRQMSALELARYLALVLTTRIEVGYLSVYTLVSLGRHPYLDWFGRLRPHDHAIIHRALELTDSLSLAQRFFHELSDGERQRVMIARALAQEPQVLILDEPTAFLDLPRRIETLRLLRNLARQTRCAVLLSIHDLDLALRIADRLWLLSSNGEFQSGVPEELALNGAVARLFEREGVYFNHDSGAFRMHQAEYGPISLHGEKHGVTLAWTWRALERIGYEVHNQGIRLPWHVEINGERCWQLFTPAGQSEHTSLESLLAVLQQAIAEGQQAERMR